MFIELAEISWIKGKKLEDFKKEFSNTEWSYLTVGLFE